jgi:hypothetical protein
MEYFLSIETWTQQHEKKRLQWTGTGFFLQLQQHSVLFLANNNSWQTKVSITKNCGTQVHEVICRWQIQKLDLKKCQVKIINHVTCKSNIGKIK